MDKLETLRAELTKLEAEKTANDQRIKELRRRVKTLEKLEQKIKEA